MADKFTQIGVFGEDETLTIKASYDAWWSVIEDLRVGVTEFTKTVDEIEKDVSDMDAPNQKMNAPYIKILRETINIRTARIELLNNIVEGEGK